MDFRYGVTYGDPSFLRITKMAKKLCASATSQDYFYHFM
ncbi:hypothetical protein RC62_2998 [Flavobacterium aquidurense]|uniref:Uncharacterized protein n=1 Tax=Flavobacterium aquidurense TaxID=362413 RepID=A0A0Q0XPM6_9FLAO|nr:hypothetical protein RC62_2998 [Flavobacterium aquidurense]